MVSDNDELEHSGERMVPERSVAAEFWAHIFRYRFAAPFVKGRRVLDLACGEGYGAAGLAQAGASAVVGVDCSAMTCRDARKKYGLDTLAGDAESMPLRSRAFDAVVSFETVEHIQNPATFIRECARVLRPGGRLIVSTPNAALTAMLNRNNPYHVNEMTREEILQLLATAFRPIDLYHQLPFQGDWWLPESLRATESPWKRIKGFWRLRNTIQSRVSPDIFTEPGQEKRKSTATLIAGPESRMADIINPYVVRKTQPWSCQVPAYYVAVANKPADR